MPEVVALDSTEIASQSARNRVLATVSGTGVRYRNLSDFWDDFADSKRRSSIPSGTLVMGDLANILRRFRSLDRHTWIAWVRTTRPYFLAFIRTESDKRSASLIDDLMRNCDLRLTVCSDPSQTVELNSCIQEAFVALEPDSIAAIRYSASVGTLCIEFRDGLVGHLALEELGLADLRGEMVLESATLGEWGKTLELTKIDGSLFEIDSASVRAVLDSGFATEIADGDQASNAIVGEKVRRARMAAGMTQIQLGELSGHDQAILSKLERGRHTPRLDTLRRIADALRTNVSALLH